MEPGISLCMIVRDEEKWITDCLKSALPFVDECIIGDTGSVDKTVEIVQSNGAQVIALKWEDDFSKARNATIKQANREWILILDADEELDPESAQVLKKQLDNSIFDAARLEIVNLLSPADMVKSESFWAVRIFRNDRGYLYENEIHEQISGSIQKYGGRIENLPVKIIHKGYSQQVVQGEKNRLGRNWKMLENALKKTPSDPYLNYQLGLTLFGMEKKSEAFEIFSKLMAKGFVGLSGQQREKILVRMSQIALDNNAYNEAIAITNTIKNGGEYQNIRIVIRALSFIYLKDYHQALPLLQEMKKMSGNLNISSEKINTLIRFCQAQMA